MKFKYVLIIILMLLLSSCNLPKSESTPDSDLVATIVEQTLTAESLKNQLLSSPSPTSEILVEETPTATYTTQPTSTATVEATLTATPTGTATPSDFKTSLGEPDWVDPLDTGSNFGLGVNGYQDEYTSVKIQDGGMLLSNSSQFGYRGWRLTSKAPLNFYLEASISVINCAENDTYGLVFRAPDYSSGYGYYLSITCNGKYNITKWDNKGIQNLFSPTQNEYINAGENKVNLLGIYAENNIYKIYINDQFLSEVTDSSYVQNGHFGVFISGQSPGEFTIKMETIQLWELD